jgi:hypothetical protein
LNWVTFNTCLGSSQRLPPERRCVLVQLPPNGEGSAPAVAVGYLRFAAGDKECPYFVTPGIGGTPVAWCDCLPGGFYAPLWKLPQHPNEAANEPQSSSGRDYEFGSPLRLIDEGDTSVDAVRRMRDAEDAAKENNQ